MVRQGMGVVGVPVGTEQIRREFVQKVVDGKSAELVKALDPMEGAQVSFQILYVSTASRVLHLLRIAPPSIIH